MKRLISAHWHAGLAFRDVIRGPEMIVLPRGRGVMGFPPDCPQRTDDWQGEPQQRQQFTVQIDYEFAVGKYPVTFDQWNACVKDVGTIYKPNDEGWGRGNRPVINVSWDDIQQYLAPAFLVTAIFGCALLSMRYVSSVNAMKNDMDMT